MNVQTEIQNPEYDHEKNYSNQERNNKKQANSKKDHLIKKRPAHFKNDKIRSKQIQDKYLLQFQNIFQGTTAS